VCPLQPCTCPCSVGLFPEPQYLQGSAVLRWGSLGRKEVMIMEGEPPAHQPSFRQSFWGS
jgi:hypothetical protein